MSSYGVDYNTTADRPEYGGRKRTTDQVDGRLAGINCPVVTSRYLRFGPIYPDLVIRAADHFIQFSSQQSLFFLFFYLVLVFKVLRLSLKPG